MGGGREKWGEGMKRGIGGGREGMQYDVLC